MKLFILTIVAVVVMGGSVIGGHLTTASEKATAPGIKIVDAEIKLAAGKFELKKIAPGTDVVATLQGDYDDAKYKYDYNFEPSGKRADFYFSSEIRSYLHKNFGDGDNHWEIGFSPDVELRLTTDIGAAKADVDFGDLSVSELKLDVGAADVRVDFSTPNKTTLNRFKISAGACNLKMKNLGNSRFDRLDFEGGVGDFSLDFSGQFDYRAEAKIEVGLGSIEIVLPSDIGVRLEADNNFLSSVNFPKRELKRIDNDSDVDIYETDNFNTAKGQLVLRLEIGLGSANIKFR